MTIYGIRCSISDFGSSIAATHTFRSRTKSMVHCFAHLNRTSKYITSSFSRSTCRSICELRKFSVFFFRKACDVISKSTARSTSLWFSGTGSTFQPVGKLSPTTSYNALCGFPSRLRCFLDFIDRFLSRSIFCYLMWSNHTCLNLCFEFFVTDTTFQKITSLRIIFPRRTFTFVVVTCRLKIAHACLFLKQVRYGMNHTIFFNTGSKSLNSDREIL